MSVIEISILIGSIFATNICSVIPLIATLWRNQALIKVRIEQHDKLLEKLFDFRDECYKGGHMKK